MTPDRSTAAPAHPTGGPPRLGPAPGARPRGPSRSAIAVPALVPGLVLGLVMAALLVAAPPAAAKAAHPLGNFTVNHYNGLRVYPDRVANRAIVDYAELPTLQARPAVDTDSSGTVTPEEARAYARTRCAELVANQRITVNGTATAWRVESASFAYHPGQSGLLTSKLTCELSAAAADGRVTSVGFDDSYLVDRIGWREITVTSEGVRLAPSGLPARSISDELRAYPEDLLTSPPNQRSAKLRVEGGAAAPGPEAAGAPSGFSLDLPFLGPLGDALAGLERTFTGLIGTSSLTVPLGLLAVVLAVVLGAGHALIPGHGKTIMAAYLAGRRGRPRDAFVVGASVTLTHTFGVLVVGLLLSVFSTLAGESVLAWLGLASGVLIAVVGARLLWSAFRADAPDEDGHSHGHGHGHGHSHGHGHGHGLGFGHGHGHGLAGTGRGGLIGLGIAGGLVPSPSALIVLLGAIGLGRTWFGVALVAAYGLGLAATLTATGLLLVKLAGRLDRLAAARRGLLGRVAGLAPVGTAAMVVVLGTGIAVRSLAFAV